eukprot:TRINITY_DN2160_c0_g1_i1.p2 TRINITY_DN2160_c0_g1~~TRINITY_DN2160_c0_g1_i1.p2  ORF type:complete len:114 (-),score=18.28 TRINITY_DN2160_c0_g1_i1:340-681(-)
MTIRCALFLLALNFVALQLIPAFGFGDVTTTDKIVFPFFPDARPCDGVSEVLARYNEITPHVNLSGPTSFAPLIDKAIEIVQATRAYHILIMSARCGSLFVYPQPNAASLMAR